MKTIFPIEIKALTLCVGFFSLFGCKERTVTKTDLIPPVDNINTFALDNFGLVMTTGVQDSLVTNDYTNNTVGIGYISDDPFFGKTTMGAYMQFLQPSAAAFSFPTGFSLDSALLLLPYSKFSYGDTLPAAGNLQYLNVYRVTGDLKREDSFKYYNFDVVATAPTPIGSGIINLEALTDTFALPNGDTLSHQLRIKLDHSFAQEFLNADSSVFANSDAFLGFFKGIYVAPDVSHPQSRIAYFNLLGSATNNTARISFFGKVDTTSRIYSFAYSSLATAFFNTIKRDYSGNPAAAYHNQPGISDSIIIQEYPGFNTTITINDLDQIPPAIINKAQLVFYVLPTGGTATFPPPMQLYPEEIADDGTHSVLFDLLLLGMTEGLNYMNGRPSEVTIGGQKYFQYVFNLPRALQKARDEGKTYLKLEISSIAAYSGSFRMVGAGVNGAGELKAGFNVIYTKQN